MLTPTAGPISPGIYGMNGADPALRAELRLPIDRWGGNDKERYNWRIATKNTGKDWFSERRRLRRSAAAGDAARPAPRR